MKNKRPPLSRQGRPGALSPAEFRAIRKRLNLSHAEMAKLLGVGSRTIYHWEHGSRHVPLIAAKLLAHIMTSEFFPEEETDHELVNELIEKIS